MKSTTPWSAEDARSIILSLKHLEGILLPALQALQEHFGSIDKRAIPLLADELNLSEAEILGVISFYSAIRTEPTGRHIVQVCRAEACQSVGGRQLEADIKTLTGLDYHETSEDGNLTLEPVYCLGNCACGPSLRVDDRVEGRVDAERARTILSKLTADREAGA